MCITESLNKLDTDGNIYLDFLTPIESAKKWLGETGSESDTGQIIGHGSDADRKILIKITKINMYCKYLPMKGKGT